MTNSVAGSSPPSDRHGHCSTPDEATATGSPNRTSFYIFQDDCQRLSLHLPSDVSDAVSDDIGSDHSTIVPSSISTNPRRDSHNSAAGPTNSTEYSNAYLRDNAAGQTPDNSSFDDEVRMAHSGESQPLKEAVTAQHETASDRSREETNSSDETLWKTWWLELLSNLLALGCIAAIAMILSLHDEKPLPDWPALISVNSLAAIFTAVFKASLIMPVAEGLGQLKWNWFRHPQRLADIVLFDDASRGPWGSLLLIITQLPRPQKAYLAGLGCLITIAALAIDPISQAMIEHRGCHIIREPGVLEAAVVPRANYYTASEAWSPEQIDYAIDPTMEAALNKGLIDPEETETQIKAQCSTGNCTFLQGNDGYFFSSLAMGHSCQDVTDRVIENKTGIWHLKDSTLRLEKSSYMATLSIAQTPAKVYDEDQRPFLSFDILMATFPECKDEKIYSLCSFTRAKIAPLAVRCRLDPGVKRYKGEITNGIYTETYDEEPIRKLRSCPTSPIHNHYAWTLVTNSSLIDGEEKACSAVADETPQSVRVDSTWNTIFQHGAPPNPDDVTWRYYPQECVWAMSTLAGNAIQYSLASLVGQNVTAITGLGGFIGHVNGPIWLKQAYAGGQGNLSMVDNMFRGLANSITAAIRNNPGTALHGTSNETSKLMTANGSISSAQTCVYVHWGWIAFPLSLLVLQWIFLALVLASRRPGVGGGGKDGVRTAWKSSPLALLFHGLDEDLRKNSSGLSSVKDMGKFAGRVNVQLAPVDGSKDKGWRFYES